MNPNFSLRSPVWQKNLDALQRRDRDLLYAIQEAELDGNTLAVRYSPNGQPVLGIRQSTGYFMSLDDLQNPRQRADEWLFRLNTLNRKNGHLMLVGLGTGYCALSLFQNSEDNAFLWFVEPNPTILKAALHVLDFTPLIQSPRVRFLAGKSPETVAALPFDGVTGNRMRAQGIQVQSSPAAQRLYAAYLQTLSQAIQRIAKIEAMKLKTMEVQGRYVLANSAANLSAILSGAPFLRLVGCAVGLPVLVVGPGPSLEGCLDSIRSARDRVLIVAVDTALRSLYRGGITPDMVVGVDFSDLNARHYEGVPLDDAVLAASPTVHPSIPQRFAGRTFFFNHHATRFIQAFQSLGALGTVHVLGSTAHAAYRIAREMGCSPIILVGIDLSFPGDRRYAPGAVQNDLQAPQESPDSLCEIPANDGSMVKTTQQFRAFRDSLAKTIRETAGNVVTASLHGAQIPGCPYQSLNEILSEIPTKPIDRRFLRDLLSPNLANRHKDVWNELIAIKEELAGFSQKLLDCIQQVRQSNESGERFPGEIETALDFFFSLQNRYNLGFKLCTPLSPATTILLFGAPGQFYETGHCSLPERASIKAKLLNALTDFHRAAVDNRQAIEHAFDIIKYNM